jgi:hypothetical protein
MDLEKLPELVLEKLVEQCDFSSKLNLMLVSKRFYNLIGRNPRLCKLKFYGLFCRFLISCIPTGRNFQLILKNDGIPLAELKNIGRVFGSIRFNSLAFNDDNFLQVHQLISRTGFGISRLEFFGGSITQNQLHLLLSIVQNVVETIIIENLTVQDSEMLDTRSSGELKFSKMKKLVVRSKFNQIYSDLFRNAHFLENLKLAHSFDIIQGKTKLQKLAVGCFYHCVSQDGNLYVFICLIQHSSSIWF